ncbi:unnamed protein product [Timema podura]|uniref:Uncharacterized protein n=1 Tax=Timema podura TaxID=61482 RepID=A0ABN7P0W2_TIMPD|nr:unnamed protein product [Timema podura]
MVAAWSRAIISLFTRLPMMGRSSIVSSRWSNSVTVLSPHGDPTTNIVTVLFHLPKVEQQDFVNFFLVDGDCIEARQFCRCFLDGSIVSWVHLEITRFDGCMIQGVTQTDSTADDKEMGVQIPLSCTQGGFPLSLPCKCREQQIAVTTELLFNQLQTRMRGQHARHVVMAALVCDGIILSAVIAPLRVYSGVYTGV